MAEPYLVVVDMQNDFVDGSLGTKEAQGIVSKTVEKASGFPGKVLFTQDTPGADYLNTQEGKMLRVEHCIKESEGWRIIPQLKAVWENGKCPVFEKDTFGSVELARFLQRKYQENEVESVELVGLCTDICVISNALLLKAYMPQLPVFVDASCCAGVSPEKHEAALATMESCQIILKNREEKQ